MRVQDILTSKQSQSIETIKPNAKVAEAAERLSSLRIGSLVVSEDGKTLAGILSERDIVRELGRKGGACLDIEVKELMTSEVKSVTGDMAAQDALGVMSEGRFRHLPVVENGELIGLISIGDVVSARLKQIEAENSALNDMISGSAF